MKRAMKQIGMIFIMLIVLSGCRGTDPKDIVIEEIMGSDAIENDDRTITREECITGIMRLVGVNDNLAKGYTGEMIETIGPDGEICRSITVFHGWIYMDTSDGYIYAAKWNGITGDDVNEEFFRPKEDASIQDCLGFMLRCLVDRSKVTEERVMDLAVEKGLIEEGEYSEKQAMESITEKEFIEFLSRMLESERYLYFEPTDTATNPAHIDQTGEKRYIDWILEQGNANFIEERAENSQT